jgi:hypothetical protein
VSAVSNGAQAAVGSVTDAVGTAANKAKGPLLAGGAAAAGVLGGVVLGGRYLRPGTKVLGVQITRRKGVGMRPMAKELRRAGSQVGRMADEVLKAREQVQKVGKALG